MTIARYLLCLYLGGAIALGSAFMYPARGEVRPGFAVVFTLAWPVLTLGGRDAHKYIVSAIYFGLGGEK